jgi:hydroxymethylbilane synthase
MDAPDILRLGTRGSPLARAQSGQMAEALGAAHAGLRIQTVVVATSGDRLLDHALADVGGKGLFTKELEVALLAGRIDFAVHSLKDVPVTQPLVEQTDLILAAIPARQDPRDLLACRTARSLMELPAGARVGTGSLRRRGQILQARPDLNVLPLRGNVETRLRKLENGEFDAIVLAAAGLKRLGLFDAAWMNLLEPQIMLPAAGQGALALQCRRQDQRTLRFLSALNDPTASRTTTAERAVVAGLGGDCHSPIAALAEIKEERLILTAAAGRRDGQPPVARAQAAAPPPQWRDAVEAVCKMLRSAGAIL